MKKILIFILFIFTECNIENNENVINITLVCEQYVRQYVSHGNPILNLKVNANLLITDEIIFTELSNISSYGVFDYQIYSNKEYTKEYTKDDVKEGNELYLNFKEFLPTTENIKRTYNQIIYLFGQVMTFDKFISSLENYELY